MVAMLVLLAIGLRLRWEEARYLNGVGLIHDAGGYYGFALKMRLFGETGFYSAQFGPREPLFIAWLRIVMRTLDESQAHARLATTILSLVWIGVAYVLGERALRHRAAGVGVAAAMALNPALAFEAVQGLRTEMLGIFTLLLGLWSFFDERPRRWRWLITGLVGGGFALTQFYGFATTVFAVGSAAGWRLIHRWSGGRVVLPAPLEHWTPLRAAGTVAISALLFAPHLYAMKQGKGDPFFATKEAAYLFANTEFVEKWATPGFDTGRTMRYGHGITFGEYLFELHSPGEVAIGTLRGMAAIHAVTSASYLPEAMQPLAITVRRGGWVMPTPPIFEVVGALAMALLLGGGWLLCLARSDLRAVPLYTVLAVVQAAFLYDRLLLEPFRSTIQILPFMAIGAAEGIRLIAGRLLRRVASPPLQPRSTS
jgi:hypothetical protein